MEAVGVEVVGPEVGGGDKAHTVCEQRIQQPVQDHCVGDVGHMKFVKADEAVTLGDAFAQDLQGILCALHLGELAVHLTHELVEVQPGLALQRDRVEEAVHEEALAAPHPAEHVHPAGDGRPVDQLLEGIGSSALELRPLLGAALQRVHRAQLRGVALIAPRVQLGLVGRPYAGDRGNCTHLAAAAMLRALRS